MYVILEVHKTGLSRRGIVRSPTGYDDIILDTVWILDVVEKEHPENFFIKRIENRRVNTINRVLEGVVRVGSIFILIDILHILQLSAT